MPMIAPKGDIPFNKSNSWKMFNDISPKYDFLNRLLSFGWDISWRKEMAGFAPQGNNFRMLDLATGTADVLLSFIQQNPRLTEGYGIDMAYEMLKIGRRKIEQAGLSNRLKLMEGDINQIPFENNYFDICCIAFGIRNVENPVQVLAEMYRVLKPGGRALILEFSLPRNPCIRSCHLFYLRNVVPLIGGILSGHYRAYKYLNETIERFPYGKMFCSWMEKAGFMSIQVHELLFGVASIYEGKKRE